MTGIGDIVVYVGNSTDSTWAARREGKHEFIVHDIAPAGKRPSYLEADEEWDDSPTVRVIAVGDVGSSGGWASDYFTASVNSVRVIKQAEYRTLLGPEHEAVKVELTDSGWEVKGDVNELLEGATAHQLEVYNLENKAREYTPFGRVDSANYAIIMWAQRAFPRADLDPEDSCFYAYTPDEATARKLAAAINAREWMVPATPACGNPGPDCVEHAGRCD